MEPAKFESETADSTEAIAKEQKPSSEDIKKINETQDVKGVVGRATLSINS